MSAGDWMLLFALVMAGVVTLIIQMVTGKL